MNFIAFDFNILKKLKLEVMEFPFYYKHQYCINLIYKDSCETNSHLKQECEIGFPRNLVSRPKRDHELNQNSFRDVA